MTELLLFEKFGIWYDLVLYGMIWYGLVLYSRLILYRSTNMQNFGILGTLWYDMVWFGIV